MPEGTLIRAEAAKDAATFSLKAKGEPVPLSLRVAGLSVFKGIGRVPFARVEIFDGDPSAEGFEASSGDLFVPGNEIEVLAGYRGSESTIFRGLVMSQRLSVRTPGASVLTIDARHPLTTATLQRRCRTFADQGDTDAIRAICSDHGVSLEASGTTPTHERLVQWHSTDWDFALARAEACGLFFTPTDAGATLAAPPAAGDEPALSLLYGATILELDAAMDARIQPLESTGLAWDPSAQEAISATGAEPALPAAGNLDGATLADAHGQPDPVAHPGAITQEELDAFAGARLLRRRLSRLHGRVRCEGTAAPLPGAILELGGLGDRLNGRHVISAVRHTLKRGAWQTDIQFGLPPRGLLEGDDPVVGQPPAAGMLPAVHGLAIGVVSAIENDPASEFRVQVTVPTLGDAADPVWARLATFDGGSGRGAFFYPEVGDEVVLGFLAADPRHPVVLGSLHSSSRAPALSPAEANPEKGYLSREGLRLVFNDEKKSITLQTPNGNTVELSDDTGGIRLEDENGNKVVLDSSGITLESAKAVLIKSGTDTTVEAGAGLDLSASAQLAVSASAGAELSASGNVTIKGALVQIN